MNLAQGDSIIKEYKIRFGAYDDEISFFENDRKKNNKLNVEAWKACFAAVL